MVLQTGIRKNVSRMNNIVLSIIMSLTCVVMFGQGGSLSPNDLKQSYLEKRGAFEQVGTKGISTENQKELDRIVSLLEVNAPDSYEYHFVKYVNGNYNLDLKNDLFAALKLKPDAREVQKELLGYHLLTGNQVEAARVAQTLQNAYSKNTLAYYRFLLNQSKVDYIVLSGEDDAYPALILQLLKRVDRQVEIVNLDFLQNSGYHGRINKKFGLGGLQFIGNEKNYMAAMLKAGDKKMLVSTTVSQSYLSRVATSIYVTGLTYQYNCSDQLKELRRFWKNSKEVLARLKLESRKDRGLYGNYLPPLLTLYKLEILNGNKDNDLRNAILELAEKTKKEKQVKEIISAYEQTE